MYHMFWPAFSGLKSLTTQNRKPASAWERFRFVPAGASMFMPVQRLAGKFAWTIFTADDRTLQVACPMCVKVFI